MSDHTDDSPKTPTRAELELLKVLWELGRGTVREVLDALPEDRRPAYTTVLTILRILTDKGFLRRHRVARADVYEPVETRLNVERGLVRDLIDRVFGGSSRRLLVHLVDEGDMSLSEIRELERLAEADASAEETSRERA